MKILYLCSALIVSGSAISANIFESAPDYPLNAREPIFNTNKKPSKKFYGREGFLKKIRHHKHIKR